MKKILITIITLTTIFAGCATVQSIVRSTFPYTATLVIPASASANNKLSVSSDASSFDQVFTGQNSNSNQGVKEVRIASAKIDASNPSNQNLGVFKSIHIYISRSDGSHEALVAFRTDIAPNVGTNLVLDIDNSRFLDEYIKGSGMRIRMEYVLRQPLNMDASVKASLGFSAAPANR